MTRFEWAELAMIGLAMALAWPLLPYLPGHTSGGGLLTAASATLLGQSLVRDIALLARARASEPRRRGACLCIESLVGAFGVATGIALALSRPEWRLAAGPPVWAAALAATLVSGFLLKDLVLTWWPVRIRRDPDHLNVIVTLR